MNIINKLTLKHIKQNRTRTIVTIIGIALSVAMLTAVLVGIKSGRVLFRNAVITDSGKWHVAYENLSPEQFAKLKEHKEMEAVYATRNLGFGKLTKANNERKPYIYVRAYEEAAFENMPVTLEEGRMPASGEEIVVSRNQIDENSDIKIGDKVTYELGARYVKSTTDEDELNKDGIFLDAPLRFDQAYLSEDSPIYSDKNGNWEKVISTEEIRGTGKKSTFTVVGIVEEPKSGPLYYCPGYVAYTKLEMDQLHADERVTGYTYYKNVSNSIFEQVNQICGEIAVEEEPTIHKEILEFEGISQDDKFNKFLKGMYLILITIIMIGSVSLIYNSFAISISERSKQLGMLASVGATKRQKRNSVFFEAGVYGAVGIPVGLVAGILGLGGAFKVVNALIRSQSGEKVELSLVISAPSIVVVIGLAIITILISAYIPARKASKISAMEAIRQTRTFEKNEKGDYSVKQMPIFSFKGGEKIECYKNMDEKRGMFSFTVAATAVGRPMGIERYPDSVDKNLIVLLPDRNFDAMMKETNEEVFGTSNIYISTKEETVVEKELTTILREKKIKKEDYCLDNVAKNQKETRQLLYAVSIFAYGFIILMSLICCANMCNTISTSIALRRTEFAMLRSVGMTPKSFRKMIRFESLWYGVKAMLYGLPISSVIAYGLYLYVGERFTVSYFLPWYIYGLVVVLVFGVIGIVMFWSSKNGGLFFVYEC